MVSNYLCRVIAALPFTKYVWSGNTCRCTHGKIYFVDQYNRSFYTPEKNSEK